MNFKEQIAFYLQTCVDKKMTHQEIAEALGLPKGNVVTMHLDPLDDISPFPLKRLPALARLCGLDAMQSLRLVNLRATHHPKSATQFDYATMAWLMRLTTEGLMLRKAAKGPAPLGVAHGR